MKTTRKIWVVTAIAIALFLAGSVLAQVADREIGVVRSGSSTMPDREDLTPLDSRVASPAVTPAATAPVMRTLSSGHDLAPMIPGEAMDIDSRDIYIYVTLLAPVGPDPPDTVKIISKNCGTASGGQSVEFKTDLGPTGYYGDFFNVYRDTVPLFYMSQLDTTPENRNLIGRTVIRFFTDDFTGTAELPDTLWQHYWSSSKGVCDTLVNLFYTFTTVDTGASAPGGFAESSYPSWCLCEYDQPIYAHPTFGTSNWLSIPNVDDNYQVCSDLEDLGIRQVMEWDAASQVPVPVGTYNPMFGWLLNRALLVGHVYQVLGDYSIMSGDSTFQTYTPGIIPQSDTVYTLAYNPVYGGRNVIMLPFKVSIVEGITDRATFETSIEEAGISSSVTLTQIDKWDGVGFTWIPIAAYNPIFGWTANPHLTPGRVYRIWITSTSGTISFSWPLS